MAGFGARNVPLGAAWSRYSALIICHLSLVIGHWLGGGEVGSASALRDIAFNRREMSGGRQ